MNTKELKNKIKSVSSTLQLTKAMGLVASSKIKSATQNMSKYSEYAGVLDDALDILISSKECKDSVFVCKNNLKNTKIIVISGDRGLAGGYNSNVFKLAESLDNAEFVGIGKRAFDKYKSGIVSSEKCTNEELFALSDSLCSLYKSGGFGKLGVIYTKYVSALKYSPQIKWMLPLHPSKLHSLSYISFEPEAKAVLHKFVRDYIAGMLSSMVRESYACEVFARKNAMNSAEKNAKEMIDNLSIEYSMARQSAITREIGEIIAGSNV